MKRLVQVLSTILLLCTCMAPGPIYVCPGDDLQAAVDEAESHGYYAPEVVVRTGRHRISSPLLIGWENGKPQGNNGCMIRGEGRAVISWSGPAPAKQEYLIRHEVNSNGLIMGIENLELMGMGKVGGLLIDSQRGINVRDLLIWEASGVGLDSIDCYFGRFKRVMIQAGTGTAIRAIRTNAASFRDIAISWYSSDGGTLVDINGSVTRIEQWNIEDNAGYDDLVRLSGGNIVATQLRFEAKKKSSAHRKQAKTYINVDGCNGAVIENVQASSVPYPCRMKWCKAEGRIVTLRAEFEDRLLVGDVVRVKGPGDYLGGEYRIVQIDDDVNQIELDRQPDPGVGLWVEAPDLADRDAPTTCIRLRNSKNVTVRNIATLGFREAVVDVGPGCSGFRHENVRDTSTDEDLDDKDWFWVPHPELIRYSTETN